MRILFLSNEGNGLSLAIALSREGNDVRAFCPNAPRNGEGLVDCVGSWRPHIPWADLVVADEPGWGAYEETLRRFGKPLFGISKSADLLSERVERQLDLLEKSGVSVPRHWTLGAGDSSGIENVLSEWPDEGVVVEGERCEDPSTFQFVAEMYRDEDPLVMERLIGVEVQTVGFYNGRGWMEPFHHAVTHGREGGVVIRSGGDDVVKSVLLPIEGFLSMIGHRGMVVVRSFVDNAGATAIGVTAGVRVELLEAICSDLRTKLVDLLFETAQGVRTDVGSRRSVTAFVAARSGWAEGAPIEGLCDEGLKHLWPNRVRVGQEKWHCGIGESDVFRATAWGQDGIEALKRATRTVREIRYLNKKFDPWLRERIVPSLDFLKEGGMIRA